MPQPATKRLGQVETELTLTTWGSFVFKLKRLLYGVESGVEVLEHEFTEGALKVRRVTKAIGRGPHLVQAATAAKNSFTSSERFVKMCKSAFKEIDFDSSGTLDATEVYCAVLLLYTKILAYVPCATPPSQKTVQQLVRRIDSDQNGHIDQQEFVCLATLLSARVAARVTTQALFFFVVAPLLSMAVLGAIDTVFSAPPWVPGWIIWLVCTTRPYIVVALVMATAVPASLQWIERGAETSHHGELESKSDKDS